MPSLKSDLDALPDTSAKLTDFAHLPALDQRYAIERQAPGLGANDPPPRILRLYGSLRMRSCSRHAVEEAARLLRFFCAEKCIFDPSELPLLDQVKVPAPPADVRDVVFEEFRRPR